jgi:hypothetical protein
MRTTRASARWVVLGLAATAAGFLGASLDPGAGPRTVNGALRLGPFYLPPLLVALVCLAIAALAARHVRYSLVAGCVLAAVLLIGSATMGSAAISYRVSHPTHPLGFTEDWLQLLGEATAAVPAALSAARHRLRKRRQPTTKPSVAARPHA